MGTLERKEDEKEAIKELVTLSKEGNALTANLVDFAKKRTDLAERRTHDAETRTELALKCTELTERQTGFSTKSTELAEKRTSLSLRRTDLAETRNYLSNYRSILAKGRTELAFICTGLAFVTLGSGMMRYFGFGVWTLLDGGLIIAGAAAVIYGMKGYAATYRYQKTFSKDLLLKPTV